MSAVKSNIQAPVAWIVADSKAGDYRIDGGKMGAVEMISGGAAVGGAAGSAVPVIGNAVGTAIGAGAGAVYRLFRGSGRKRVADVIRPMFHEAFGKVLPGRVGELHKGVSLRGEYEEADIMSVVASVKSAIMKSIVGADRDTQTDVSRYIGSIHVLRQQATPDLGKYDPLVRFNVAQSASELAKQGQASEQTKVRDAFKTQTTSNASNASNAQGAGIGSIALVGLIGWIFSR